MPPKVMRCKHEAAPPRNPPGRTGAFLSADNRVSCFRNGIGSCISAASLCNCELGSLRSTWHIRSRCSSAAKKLSSSSEVRLCAGPYSMTIGRDGQNPRFFLTGVLCVQRSWRSRRRDDPKTICRQLRQTCTSVSQLHDGGIRVSSSV